MKPTPMYRLIVPPTYTKTGRQKECGIIIMSGPLFALRRHARNVNLHTPVNFQIRRWDGQPIGTPIKSIRLP
jgi:hypothetical protein